MQASLFSPETIHAHRLASTGQTPEGRITWAFSSRIGFVTVSTDNGDYQAYIEAEREPNFGDSFTINWMDKVRRRIGSYRIFEDGDTVSESVEGISEDDIAYWEATGGAASSGMYDFHDIEGAVAQSFRDIDNMKPMSGQEIAELPDNLSFAVPNRVMTEKALSYLEQDILPIRRISRDVIDEENNRSSEED